MTSWTLILAGAALLLLLAVTGILDKLLTPLLRRILGQDRLDQLDDRAKRFRQKASDKAEQKSMENLGYWNALRQGIQNKLQANKEPDDEDH